MKKLIIWGTGSRAQSALDSLSPQRYQLVCFVDSNLEKCKQSFHGHLVIPPDQLPSYVFDELMIASCYHSEILETAKSVGVKRSKISFPFLSNIDDAKDLPVELQTECDVNKKTLINLGDFSLYVFDNDYVSNIVKSSEGYEPHVAAEMRRVLKEGDTLLDLGANLGFFTMLGARQVKQSGNVLAFEPNPQNQQMIKASIVANGFNNVTVYPYAVSNKSEVKKFITVGSNGGIVNTPFISSGEQHEAAEGCKQDFSFFVQSVILDDFLKHDTRIDVIKMDIEAHEPYAFSGMKELIRRQRPIIFSEFHPWAMQLNNPEPARDYLENIVSSGYALSIIPLHGEIIEASNVDAVMSYWETLSYTNPQIHIDIIAHPI